jgi:hypothetical protein
MDHIFGCATEVLAWLGEANNLTVPVMQNMKMLGVIPEELMTKDVGPKILNPLEDGLFDDEELIQIFEFSLEFNWFTRIWIVQEMLLAQKLIFICGTSLMGLETVWATEVLLAVARAFFGAKRRSFLLGYLTGHQEIKSSPSANATEVLDCTSGATPLSPFEFLDGIPGMKFLSYTTARMDCIDYHYNLAGRRSFSPFGGLSTILETMFRNTFRVDGQNKHPLSLLANELRVKKAKNPRDKLYGILGFSSTSGTFEILSHPFSMLTNDRDKPRLNHHSHPRSCRRYFY